MKRIQDALHGYIELNEAELEVLDSPEIQRLRRIKQLGLSSMVYPSVTHSRFEHSLGVMHLAGEFAESIDLSSEQVQQARLAGLLHDSGHGPFSHASEILAEKKGLSHEDLSCRVVDGLEDKVGVETEPIKEMIQVSHEISVVAGDIDADRLDYLMRDSHASGLEYGMIDHDTIISSAERMERKIVFDERSVSALESLFTSRFHMIKTLYTHHAVTIAEKMLQRSLEGLLESHSIKEVMAMDDYTAHNRLLDSENYSSEIYSAIKDRNLYKTALNWGEDELTRKGLKVAEERINDLDKIEREIAETAEVPEHKVIVDPPKTPEINDIDVRVDTDNSVKKLQEISPLPNALQDAEWRTVELKVYCPENHTKEVREAAEKVLRKHRNALGEFTG